MRCDLEVGGEIATGAVGREIAKVCRRGRRRRLTSEKETEGGRESAGGGGLWGPIVTVTEHYPRRGCQAKVAHAIH